MDLVLQNVSEEVAKRLLKKGYVEAAFRKGNQRFEAFKKVAVKVANNQKQNAFNPEVLGKLNVALAALNLAATIASTVIICNKLNQMSGQLDEIRRSLEEIKDIQVKTTVLQSDARLVENYKIYSRKLEKGEPVSKEEMHDFIRDCNRNINTLYSVRNEVDLDAILGEIFILMPMMCNYIKLYYKTYYSAEEGTCALHNDWMRTLDLLASDEFMNQIQDYLFNDKDRSNKEVNEYLFCQRYIISQNKQEIEQLLQDLQDFDGVEGYEDVMQWSRQYVLQQAKAEEKELAAEYGEETAKAAMEQAMQAVFG